jgi:hypothetical protein
VKEFDDFKLRITACGSSGYLVEADAAHDKSAAANFELPLGAEDFDDIAERVAAPQRVTRGRAAVTPVKRVEKFGAELFTTVFGPEVSQLYRGACQQAADDDRGVRLVLSLRNAPELLDVPWEFLYDRPNWLSLSTDTALVRVLELSTARKPVQIDGPVRVLGMVSSPSDYDELDVDAERRTVDGALAPLVAKGLAEVVWLPAASLSALNKALTNGQFHVFHYVGHAGFDRKYDEGHLVLEGADGKSDEVTGSALGTILQAHRPLRLAFVNACEGARTSVEDPFTGVATSLVEREIPAVVAMQFEITDQAALVFAEAFYASLVDGRNAVDVAVAEGRRALFAENPNALEWGTPVLFMRAHEVGLFDFGERTTAASGVVDRPSEPVDLAAPAALHEPSAEAQGREDRVVPEPPEAGILGAADRVVEAAATPRVVETPEPQDPTPEVERTVEVTGTAGELLLRAQEMKDLRHGAPLIAAAISADGRLVATVGADGVVIAWSSDGAELRRWTGVVAPADIALSHDGNHVAVAGYNGCWVFETGSGKQVALLSPGKERKSGVTAVDFPRDGSSLVAANDRGIVERWRILQWRSLAKAQSPKGAGAVTQLAGDATGRRIALSTQGGQLCFWEASRPVWASNAVPAGAPVADVAGGTDCWCIASGSDVLLVSGDGDEVLSSHTLTSTVTTVDVMPGSMWVVAASSDSKVVAWDGAGVRQLDVPSASVLSRIRFTTQGLLTAGADGVCRLWKVTQAN